MRFESLTLQHYGRAPELRVPAGPGLNIIFGQNEAGKSTSLEAIADFLYGVPERSARGQIFGADKIGIGASIVRADGTRLELRRRKGRLRTLTDATGAAVDEAVLGQMLGSTDRDKFAALFGLSHAGLRSGGERLLKAEGDIGRLILDAGGGLRPLIDAIDGLRAQASELFDTRKAANRLFYIGLAAYEEADRTVRGALMTREEYDKARQRLNAAQNLVAGRRRRLAELTEEKLRLARLARVVPVIREIDRLTLDLGGFADVAPLREDFAAACAAALGLVNRREEALGEAESRCRTLQARIDALPPPAFPAGIETVVRDLGEKAILVAKARQDRANRETELAQISAKLNALRAAVERPADAALEASAPPPEAIRRVQKLATLGAGQRGALAGINEERRRESVTKEAIVARQAERRAAGRHQPSGLAAADFADLPALEAATAAQRAQLENIAAEIDAALEREGFASAEDAEAWAAPDAAVIEAEMARRAALEAELGRVVESIAAATEQRARAGADATRLMAGAPVPSSAALAAARLDRDNIWGEISARYLDGAAAAARPLEARRADVEAQQARTLAADDLADRRSSEAERVAALDLAQRSAADADIALATLAERRDALRSEGAALAAAWRQAWPEAAAHCADIGRLKRAVGERAALMARRAAQRAQTEALAMRAAEIAQRLEALAQAEARLRLSPAGSLAARKAAAAAGLRAHEEAYADYRRDEAALQDSALKLGQIDEEHRRLVQAEADWRAAWAPAVQALGLDAETDPDLANEIATLWAGAAGHFEAARVTRNRLTRMDDDEAQLRALVDGVAPCLDFALPRDAVAAARMLTERADAARKIAIERDSLSAQLAALVEEREELRRLAGLAGAGVEALCREAGATPETLVARAARCEERRALARRLGEIAERIDQLGDGLSIKSLRQSWGGRDLDQIRAAGEQLAGEAQELTQSLDEAVAAQRDRDRELEALLSEDRFNAAVAERERAAAEMHDALERYVEISLAEELLREAMNRLRDQRKDPLIRRAGELFAVSTAGAFAGVDADVDADGLPVVVGRRSGGADVRVAQMSDGVRDQLYLAFRIASIEAYVKAAEPLPFVADDLLVHFDDERSAAAMGLLAELGRTTQVLLFTHHSSLKHAAAPLVAAGLATIVDLAAG